MNEGIMTDFERTFLDKLGEKKTIVAIAGLGYVGLPLALSFAEAGYQVLGLDVDSEKVKKIGRRESYIGHISNSRLKGSAALFSATTDFKLASEADALIVCVPTPLTRHQDPDLSFVEGTLESLLPHLKEGQLLSLESTTYPGTT